MKQIVCRLVLFYSLFLISCTSTYQQQQTASRQYVIHATDTLQRDTTLAFQLIPYRDSLSRIMNEQVAYSAAALLKGLPESPLGNFVADACHWSADTYCRDKKIAVPDFTMLNQGGLRSSLPAGKISRGNIYELMPFENELVLLNLDDSLFSKLMLYIAQRKGNPVSHLQLKISDSSATDVFVNGLPQSQQHSFRLLTSDYLANGGDNLDFLKKVPAEKTGIRVRDAIFNYLQEHQSDTLKAQTDGRIRR